LTVEVFAEGTGEGLSEALGIPISKTGVGVLVDGFLLTIGMIKRPELW
jgi:hypothetical protein